MKLHPLVEAWDDDLRSADPLAFPGYAAKLEDADGESVRTGRTEHYALIENRFGVLGGSMGAVAGERIVRAYRRAVDARLPTVLVTRSGGARMQEGMVSLIQLARTADAAAQHRAAGLLSLALHRSPTTGGVLASYGSLADVRAAERDAVLGFAGPRVAADTLGAPLAADSHTAGSAYGHGWLDRLVDGADDARRWVEGALGLRRTPLAARALGAALPDRGHPVASAEAAPAGAWGEVLRARRTDRPTGIDWAATLTSSWTELRGADPTVRAGLATVGTRRVVVVASDRFAADGRPRPAGFRLVRRALALAGRLGLPVLTLVDTPGAYPGAEAEAEDLAGEIAETFAAMAGLPTPSVAVCVGEGGSGGALALAAADRLLLTGHAVFSVIAPEGAATILHRDAGRAPEVAAHLGLTGPDLTRLGIVDAVVAEDALLLAAAVDEALVSARPGDRRRRFDAVTAAALRVPDGSVGWKEA